MSSNIFGFTQANFLANLPGGGGSSLAGYVTIATEQTITGQKTFDDDAIFNYTLYTQNLSVDNSIYAQTMQIVSSILCQSLTASTSITCQSLSVGTTIQASQITASDRVTAQSVVTQTVNSLIVRKDLSNNIVIGNSTNFTSTKASAIILGTADYTQFIQGQVNESFTILWNQTNADQTYDIPLAIPQMIFLKTTGNYRQTVVLPSSGIYYAGCRLIFRKTYISNGYTQAWNCTIKCQLGQGNFLSYNSLQPVTEFDFNDGYVYVEMVCDGTWWCITNLI